MDPLFDRERRQTIRKTVYLPIKLISHHGYLEACIQDINCYGLKLSITFKTSSYRELADKILSAPEVHMEIGVSGTEVFFKSPIKIKWNNQKRCSEFSIYEIGAELDLNELQRKTWDHFFRNL